MDRLLRAVFMLHATGAFSQDIVFGNHPPQIILDINSKLSKHPFDFGIRNLERD